jgi:RimJ/RimL family protein N-acetyltransferase
MIELRPSRIEDLHFFHAMEQDADASAFILPYSLQRHRREFERREIVYLSIYSLDELAGFFILRLDPDHNSVEFRRVVIAKKGQGIGQPAILAMEEYCRDQLKRNRVWLDVFEFNNRGRHIYEKLGYRLFDSGDHDGKKLLLYEKDMSGYDASEISNRMT